MAIPLKRINNIRKQKNKLRRKEINKIKNFETLKKELISIISIGTEDQAFNNGQNYIKENKESIDKLNKKQKRKILNIVEF